MFSRDFSEKALLSVFDKVLLAFLVAVVIGRYQYWESIQKQATSAAAAKAGIIIERRTQVIDATFKIEDLLAKYRNAGLIGNNADYNALLGHIKSVETAALLTRSVTENCGDELNGSLARMTDFLGKLKIEASTPLGGDSPSTPVLEDRAVELGGLLNETLNQYRTVIKHIYEQEYAAL